MRIMRKKLHDLKTSGYNPRITLIPGDEAYEKIAASLEEFGQVLPIVWNERTGNIVGGHQRYNILKKRGIEEVDVSVVDLPLEKEKALNLALNKISGEWDNDKLAAIFTELQDEELDLTGFNSAEIDILVKSFNGIMDIDLDFDGISPEEVIGGMDESEADTESDKPEKDPIVLPPQEEPREGNSSSGGQVEFRLGEFAFTITREVYQTWSKEMKAAYSREEIAEELMIRLGI